MPRKKIENPHAETRKVLMSIYIKHRILPETLFGLVARQRLSSKLTMDLMKSTGSTGILDLLRNIRETGKRAEEMLETERLKDLVKAKWIYRKLPFGHQKELKAMGKIQVRELKLIGKMPKPKKRTIQGATGMEPYRQKKPKKKPKTKAKKKPKTNPNPKSKTKYTPKMTKSEMKKALVSIGYKKQIPKMTKNEMKKALVSIGYIKEPPVKKPSKKTSKKKK